MCVKTNRRDFQYLKYLISAMWMILDYHVHPNVDIAHIEHGNHNVDQSLGQLQA